MRRRIATAVLAALMTIGFSAVIASAATPASADYSHCC